MGPGVEEADLIEVCVPSGLMATRGVAPAVVAR